MPGEQQTAVDVGARSGVADPAPASQREHLEQVLEALQRSREARSAERTQARERQAEAARARRRRVCGAATADADRIGNTPSGEFFRRDPDDPSTVRPLGRATARAELERLQSIIDENCD